MAEVTVCIPAYRSEGFIRHTLESVRTQSFTDFEVEIGIEPAGAEATLDACAPFLDDPRFRVHMNPQTLGYAGNVRNLFRRVRTPLFVALMHDDAWHPRFLERLLERLERRPDAVCAYPDILCFAPGGVGAGVLRHRIDDDSPTSRIASWLVGGASGNLWHGLCRSSVLGEDFPDNEWQGFAVECEWALHLLAEGHVLNVAEPLYLKRQPSTVNLHSVSASWVRSERTLPAALAHHRRQLMGRLPEDLAPRDREVIRPLLEAAMLRRGQEFSDGRWGLTSEELDTVTTLLRASGDLDPDLSARLVATVRWSLSCHWSANDDLRAAEQETRSGLDVAPLDTKLLVQLGWLLIERDQVDEAAQVGLQASAADPDDPHVRLLLRQVDDELERRLRPETETSEPARESDAKERLMEDPPRGAVVTRLYRGLQLQISKTKVVEERLESSQARAVQLAEERDGLILERDLVSIQLRRAQSRAAALASRGRPPRWRRALDRRRGVLVRLGLPPPLFDATWYRREHPKVKSGPLRAWLHWRRVGWRRGYDPNPLFDTAWYLRAYPDVEAASIDPLAHYVLHGFGEGRSPGPDFDARAYRERYSDVRAQGIDPLLHYSLYGAEEGRRIEPIVGSRP